jgi:DNA invertase Pin-like site-specific DNA recombinase
MVKAIGYVRVSTDEQAREGISLENQKTKIETYCQLNDLELTGILEDAGKSGKDLNREGMQAIVTLIKARSVGAVVVYKLDRLSRRVRDTLSLMDLIEKKSIAFHSITERIDTKSAMGKFFLNIMASMNQWERDTISERTRDALHLKIAKNERAGQVPYGYTLAEDGNTLIENETEQAGIRLIKELHAEGRNYSAICRELSARGFQPLGKQWYARSIKNILKRAAA